MERSGVNANTITDIQRCQISRVGHRRKQLQKARRARMFTLLLAHDQDGRLLGAVTLSMLRCEAVLPPPFPTNKPFRSATAIPQRVFCIRSPNCTLPKSVKSSQWSIKGMSMGSSLCCCTWLAARCQGACEHRRLWLQVLHV